MLRLVKLLVPSLLCRNRNFISLVRILGVVLLLAGPFRLYYPAASIQKWQQLLLPSFQGTIQTPLKRWHSPHRLRYRNFNPLRYRFNSTVPPYNARRARAQTFKIIRNPWFLGKEVTRTFRFKDKNLRIFQRENHVFIPNYVNPTSTFSYRDSITFTTHGEFNFMDNLVPLVERWRGPISMAVFAPGSDFIAAVNRIRYLRSCSSKLIRQLVTFHMYVPANFVNWTRITPWRDFRSKFFDLIFTSFYFTTANLNVLTKSVVC